MSQNLISLSFTNEQLSAIEASLAQLESQFSGLISLTREQRRAAPKMGERSEGFCRRTLGVLVENPGLVPANVSLNDAPADLVALDQLRPLARRLRRLSERAGDTEFALGSDVMATSLQGYALLKVAGNNQGLESVRDALRTRFSRGPRSTEAKAA